MKNMTKANRNSSPPMSAEYAFSPHIVFFLDEVYTKTKGAIANNAIAPFSCYSSKLCLTLFS